MAPLTWRNVDAPNLSGAAAITESSSKAWGDAMGIMGDMMAKRREQRIGAASAAALAGASGITDPVAFAEYMKTVDATQVSPEALGMLMGRPQELVELRGAELSNENVMQQMKFDREDQEWDIRNKEQEFSFDAQDQNSQMESERLGREVTGYELDKTRNTDKAELDSGPIILQANQMARDGNIDGARALLEKHAKENPYSSKLLKDEIGKLPGVYQAEVKDDQFAEGTAAGKKAKEWVDNHIGEHFTTNEMIAAINNDKNLTPDEKRAATKRAEGLDISKMNTRSIFEPSIDIGNTARVSDQSYLLVSDNVNRNITAKDEQARFDAVSAELTQGIKNPKDILKENGFFERYWDQGLEADVKNIAKKAGVTEGQAMAAVLETARLGGSNLSWIDSTNDESRSIHVENAIKYAKDMTDPKQVEERNREQMGLRNVQQALNDATDKINQARAGMEASAGRNENKYNEYAKLHEEGIKARDALIKSYQDKYYPTRKADPAAAVPTKQPQAAAAPYIELSGSSGGIPTYNREYPAVRGDGSILRDLKAIR